MTTTPDCLERRCGQRFAFEVEIILLTVLPSEKVALAGSVGRLPLAGLVLHDLTFD